jgi:hypothetical protein
MARGKGRRDCKVLGPKGLVGPKGLARKKGFLRKIVTTPAFVGHTRDYTCRRRMRIIWC